MLTLVRDNDETETDSNKRPRREDADSAGAAGSLKRAADEESSVDTTSLPLCKFGSTYSEADILLTM